MGQLLYGELPLFLLYNSLPFANLNPRVVYHHLERGYPKSIFQNDA